MKAILGFILFWIAVGMLIAVIIPSDAISIIVIGVLLVIGYNLFCS